MWTLLNLITPLIAKLFSQFIEMSNLGMVMRQGQPGIMSALSPPCLLFQDEENLCEAKGPSVTCSSTDTL